MQVAKVRLMDSRQDGFIEWVAQIAEFGAAQSLLFDFEIESSRKRTSMARNLMRPLSQAKYFEQLERQRPGTMFDHHARKDKSIHSLLTKR